MSLSKSQCDDVDVHFALAKQNWNDSILSTHTMIFTHGENPEHSLLDRNPNVAGGQRNQCSFFPSCLAPQTSLDGMLRVIRHLTQGNTYQAVSLFCLHILEKGGPQLQVPSELEGLHLVNWSCGDGQPRPVARELFKLAVHGGPGCSTCEAYGGKLQIFASPGTCVNGLTGWKFMFCSSAQLEGEQCPDQWHRASAGRSQHVSSTQKPSTWVQFLPSGLRLRQRLSSWRERTRDKESEARSPETTRNLPARDRPAESQIVELVGADARVCACLPRSEKNTLA